MPVWQGIALEESRNPARESQNLEFWVSTPDLSSATPSPVAVCPLLQAGTAGSPLDTGVSRQRVDAEIPNLSQGQLKLSQS